MSLLPRKSGIALLTSLVCFSQSGNADCGGNSDTCSCNAPTTGNTAIVSSCSNRGGTCCTESSGSSTTCGDNDTCSCADSSSDYGANSTNWCTYFDAWDAMNNYTTNNADGTYLTIAAPFVLGSYGITGVTLSANAQMGVFGNNTSDGASINGGDWTFQVLNTTAGASSTGANIAFYNFGLNNYTPTLAASDCVKITDANLLIETDIYFQYDMVAAGWSGNSFFVYDAFMQFDSDVGSSTTTADSWNDTIYLTTAAAGTLTMDSAGHTIYYGGYIGPNGDASNGVTFDGGGTFVLSGGSAYTGLATIISGTYVEITNGDALGAGGIVLGGSLTLLDTFVMSAPTYFEFNGGTLDLHGNGFLLQSLLYSDTASITDSVGSGYIYFITSSGGPNTAYTAGMSFSGGAGGTLLVQCTTATTTANGQLGGPNSSGVYGTINVNYPAQLEISNSTGSATAPSFTINNPIVMNGASSGSPILYPVFVLDAGINVTLAGALSVDSLLNIANIGGTESSSLTVTGAINANYLSLNTPGVSGLTTTLAVDYKNGLTVGGWVISPRTILQLSNTSSTGQNFNAGVINDGAAGTFSIGNTISGNPITLITDELYQPALTLNINAGGVLNAPSGALSINILALSGSGTLNLPSANPLIINGTNNLTFSGSISGTGYVILNDGAFQSFAPSGTNSNTFSGGLIINAGAALTIGPGNSVGTGAITMYGNGSDTSLIGSGTGASVSNSLTLNSSAETAFTLSNITIEGPLIIFGANAVIYTASSLTLNPSQLTIGTGLNFFVSNDITVGNSNSGTTNVFGSGTGVFQLGNVYGTSTDTLTILVPSSNSSSFGGTIVDYTYTNSSGAVVIGQSTGSFTGTITLSGANTFSQGLTLNSGTLSISSSGNVGASTGTITGNGGTLAVTASTSLANPWTLTGNKTTTFNVSSGQTLTLTGAVTTTSTGLGNVQILKSGSGALTLTLSSLTINSDALQTNGNSISTATISGAGGLVLGVQNSVTPDVLTITGASTYSGAISNNGGIVTGAGVGALVIAAGSGNTVTLSGSNTFTGGVTLNSGKLSVASQSNLSSGTITGNGGTLVSAGSLVNKLVLSSSTTYFAVPSITASSVTGSGNMALEGSSGGLGTLTIAGTSNYSGIISNNTTTVLGGTAAVKIVAGTTSGVNNIATLSGVNTFTGGLTLTSGTLSINAVTNLGSSSTAIVANGTGVGATLRNTALSAFTITNPWTFVVGNTTSFEGALTLTGAFTVSLGTATLGTVTMASLTGAALDLSPSSLTIPSGATFATNGNNITVTGTDGLATGTGTLSLGKAGSPTITDTLTIAAATSVSASIANNGSGRGALVIASGSSNVVTLSGTNTFTGGITLTSGTLSISSASNIGNTSSTNPNPIIFNGGTLQNSASPTLITLVNPVTFTGGETSAFVGPFTLTGPFAVVSSGTAIVTGSSGTVTLTPSSLSILGGSTLEMSGSNAALSVLGSISITGSSGSTATIQNLGGSITLKPSSLNIAAGVTFATSNNNISVSSFGTSTSTSTLSLGTGKLTIPSSAVSTTFNGVIIGTGGVLIEGPVGFYGTNTFTGGLTLSAATTGSSVLTIQTAGGVGGSSNTITGNGGTLTTSGTSAVSLPNDWIFNAGSTTGTTINTTLSVGSSAPLTLTGTIATSTGSGTAVITAQGGGVLSLTPSTLTINSTALQITGNTAANSSISTGSISGGNLILGGGSSSSTGTLTLTGVSTYSGSISNNPTASSGVGAVVINSSGTVTFNGTTPSTFTGGLTLSGGTLAISNFGNVGGAYSSGVISTGGGITGNGGTLQIGTSSITLQNPWTFNVATTTTFTVGSGATLLLTGPFSVSTPALGTATIAKTAGGGTLTLKPSLLTIAYGSTFATNGNSLQVGTFGSCTGTTGCGTLSLGSTTVTDTLTIVSSSNNAFSGNIVDGGAGGGAVVINASGSTVSFTGTIASTFSKGLTLTAGTLSITAANQVGTGTITGNGGALTGTTTSGSPLINNLALSATTTTITVPYITVDGGGSGISGSGGLALGGILTIKDGSTYPGIISDASDTNLGSVVIDAGVNTVTFAGVNPNTFTGGLTLTSGTLVIASSINLGTGNLTGNGGTLQTDITTTGNLISNNWSFNGGTTTNFDVQNSTTLVLGGALNSSNVFVGAVFSVASGIATIANTGTGTLDLNPSSLSIVTGSTLTMSNANLNIGSTTYPGNFGTSSGTLNLTGSPATILTVASSNNTQITFTGNITGTGSVVNYANLSLFGQLNFTGGLTLALSTTSATSLLTITPSTSLTQIGSGTITGSGGGLATTGSFTVTNALQLTGGATTTFTTTLSAATLSFTGVLSTTGSGTATISTSGTKGAVYFGTTSAPLTSISIASGTTLATNGAGVVNSSSGVEGIVTSSLVAADSTGVLMLGGSNKSTDTLIIKGTGSTYLGNIVDNTSINGFGAVVINLASSLDTVTFSGNNTFSGGLTLSSGTLIISGVSGSTANIGSSTGAVTFNGGGLENSNSGLSSLITLTNPVVFYGSTAATFTNYFSLQGAMSTLSQGSGSGIVTISGTAGNTTLLNPSSLSIASSTTLATNGNSISVGAGGFACSGTSSSCSGTLSLGEVSGSVVDTLTIANTSNTTFTGNITEVGSGLGAVTISATANKSVTFSGTTASSFTGGLTLNSGTLIISSASNIGGSAGAIIGNGGTLTNSVSTANLSLTNPLSLNSGTTSLLLINITTSGVSNNLGSGNLMLGGFNSSTPGTLTINGVSSYSGEISNSSNNSTGQVVIAAGTGNTVAFSGGTSTFSGGLSLNSGILSIISSGNVGSSVNIITGNGGTLATITNTISLANPWSLTGGKTTTFTVATGQSLTLTGAIATAGSGTAQIVTTPSVGSLVLTPSSISLTSNLQTNGNSLSTASISGSGGLILGASGPITDTLTITGASTYSGIISNNSGGGLGAVVINASNKTVIFSGASTFSGGLTLTAGSLQISAANNLGSASTSITGNGGTLLVGTDAAATFTISNPWGLASSTTTTFDINDYQPSGVNATPDSTTVTLSGVISGSGALTMNGSGTLILTAANTFSGDITVSSGTLTINGSVSPTTGDFTTTVDGGGTLTIGNSSSYADATLYSESNLGTVLNSGIIQGSGSIWGTVTSESRGATCTIKPGNSIGTLTVHGDITVGTGTLFVVDISPTASSEVIITGFTTIEQGAEVVLLPNRGSYTQPMTYTIAEGDGGFTGHFDKITVLPGLYLKAVLFFENSTTLNTTVTPQSLSQDGLAQGSNAISVATALDEVIAHNRATVEWRLTPEGFVAVVPPELPLVLESLVGITTAEEMTYALNQLHPAPFKGMTIVQQNNAVEVRETLTNRMQNEMDSEHCFVVRSDAEDKCKKEKRSVQVWTTGLGDVLAQDSNTYHSNPEVGYQSKMVGAVLGIDKRFAKHYYIGALGGYTSSHMNWKQNIGTGDVNSGYAGIYASAIGKMFYGNASATVGWNEFSAKRNIIYPGVNLTAKNDHSGTQLLSHLDTGVNLGFKGLTVRPFDSFDYVAQRENSYTETDAGEWNLHVKKSNAILIRNELGLQFAGCVCFKSSKWTVAPKLSWVREVRVKGDSFVAEFVGTDSTFEVIGYYPDRSLISPGVVVSGLMLEDRLTLGAYYNGEFKGGYSSHNYGGELRFGF